MRAADRVADADGATPCDASARPRATAPARRSPASACASFRIGAGLRRDGARSAPRAAVSRAGQIKATRDERAPSLARVTDPAPGRAKPDASAGQEVTMHRSQNRSFVLAQRAAQMRSAPTASEAVLFRALRAGQLDGVRFRRQVVVGNFIVDLLAPRQKVVVEIDGGYHTCCRTRDARRDRALARLGYQVVHLDAALVLRDLPAALTVVRAALRGA